MVKLLRLAIVAYIKYDGSMPASIDYAFISKHNVRPLHVEFQVMSITYPLAVCVIRHIIIIIIIIFINCNWVVTRWQWLFYI